MDYNRLAGPQRKILRGAIARVFPRRAEFNTFLDDRDFGTLEMVVQPGSYDAELAEFVKHHAGRGKLGTVVEEIKAAYPDAPAVIDLDARLSLIDETGKMERLAAPRGGLERLVRDSGEADLYIWADKLLDLGRKICRIRYPAGAGILNGTGWLVGPDLIITNFHVIEALLSPGANAADVRITFDYAERATALNPGIDYALAANWNVRSSRYSAADLAVDAGLPADDELDYALVRLAEPAGLAITETGKQRGWVPVPFTAPPTEAGDIVFILQHPQGSPIKQTIGVTVQSPTPLRLRYDADTENGSSGALVLDASLRPIALHHAGDPDIMIKAEYNQGIPLVLIERAIGAGVLP